MISDTQVEKALEYLRDTAPDLADWRSRRVYLDDHRKSVKAALFMEAPEGPVAQREAWAYSHEDYMEIQDKLKEAVYEETLIKARRDAAEAKIEAWRSMEATKRASNV